MYLTETKPPKLVADLKTSLILNDTILTSTEGHGSENMGLTSAVYTYQSKIGGSDWNRILDLRHPTELYRNMIFLRSEEVLEVIKNIADGQQVMGEKVSFRKEYLRVNRERFGIIDSDAEMKRMEQMISIFMPSYVVLRSEQFLGGPIIGWLLVRNFLFQPFSKYLIVSLMDQSGIYDRWNYLEEVNRRLVKDKDGVEKIHKRVAWVKAVGVYEKEIIWADFRPIKLKVMIIPFVLCGILLGCGLVLFVYENRLVTKYWVVMVKWKFVKIIIKRY